MIEYKYRIWDDSKIIYQDNINWIDFKNGCASVFDKYGHENNYSKEIKIKDNISQYTSYKDMNGKEIYNGDIVKKADQGIGVIKYGKHDTTNPEGECSIGFYISWQTDAWLRIDLGYWLNKIEVIGNIYENPDFSIEPI